jgi:hypothetical protein
MMPNGVAVRTHQDALGDLCLNTYPAIPSWRITDVEELWTFDVMKLHHVRRPLKRTINARRLLAFVDVLA